MKRLGFVLLVLLACEEHGTVTNDFTGNEAVYSLQAGSEYEVSGIVTVKEKADGTSYIITELNGTEGELFHPVHLHLGNVGTPDAEIAALLNPIKGSIGKSETTVSHLANETAISYTELIALNACIKVHLAESGTGRDIVLAGGNIGSAVDNTNARSFLAACK